MMISVEVGKGIDFEIDAPDHNVLRRNDTIVYEPRTAASIATVRNVEIGLEFHWNRRMNFRLRGELEVRPTADGVKQLINRLPLESYVESVVQSEMNPDAPFEFLKAHAVISRSWALGKVLRIHKEGGVEKILTQDRITDWLDTGDHTGFDVCADDHCQRYQGFAETENRALLAVRETSGEVLTDPTGELLDTRFSKCCGGKTELFSNCWQTVEPDPLPSVRCGYCDPKSLPCDEFEALLPLILRDYDCETRDYYEWETNVSAELIENNLRRYYGIEIGCPTELVAKRRGASGRIVELLIRGSKGEVLIGKELTIRRVLSESTLYSSDFSIEKCGEGFHLKGRGWGHGAGLCQIGAAVMGARGFGYREILKHYYPHAKIKRYE